MKNHSMFFILLIFLSSLMACVSVNLPTASGQKASDVVLAIPPKPFAEIKSKNADRAWLSEKFGNTISYISDCNNPVDPPVQQIESETLAVLNDLKIHSSKVVSYNLREASDTLAQGEVDGVKVKMRLVTFKKNNCSYSLVYGGVVEKFDEEVKFFESFLKNFKAP